MIQMLGDCVLGKFDGQVKISNLIFNLIFLLYVQYYDQYIFLEISDRLDNKIINGNITLTPNKV